MKNKVKRLAAFLMALSVTATGLVQSMSTTVLADETDPVTSVITEELTASEESETEPTPEVTAEPTLAPTAEPTVEPTAEPEITPEPSETPAATEEPTAEPSEAPSTEPSASASPSALPTADIDVEIATYAADDPISVGNWQYKIENGQAYIYKYTGKESYVTIPTSVTLRGLNYKIRTVGEYAFENNTYIQSVTIPSSIISLENGAFKNCSRLSNIVINGNIGDCNSYSTWSSSDYSVFYGAGTNTDGMTVTFGSGVTRVPAYLFATGDDWSNNTYAHVKKITLSSNITSVGAYAFYNCYDLNSTNLRDTTNLKK